MAVSTLDTISAVECQLKAAGIPEARLEAQILLSLATGRPRSYVVADLIDPLSPEQQKRLDELVAARIRRTPLAYLRGSQEFFGLEFIVTPATLIPRPETELLVERGIACLRQTAYPPVFADIGIGSGCIAVSLLKHVPEAFAIGVDIAADALSVARLNARRHQVAERLALVRGDKLSALKPHRFALIVSNPPYIPSAEIGELQPEVRDYEPRHALDGGPDGLTFHRVLVEQARDLLVPNGWLLMEVAWGQAAQVRSLFEANGYSQIEVLRDLASVERAVCGRIAGCLAQTNSPLQQQRYRG
ncbi:peptide chain release factor N(5)-glutamine methyltransferase [Chthonomonas calidirosea]|uniref:peptide chain release factor N(5)-glutamine methyltransferase n=1 Tax=Chthonomonas calidirosea TaxID=454171 RepID=UPI0006ECACB2|nr:peptide chain release factor N(5)-glutamine methyltransferase [Chthonomonas calidirosea]CEK15370.1 (protein release factor)-glutamine N5-methyltransferase [Chthonomonas calidirosea]